jgi:hypothetical protein
MVHWRTLAGVSLMAALAAGCGGGAPSPRQVKNIAQEAASWAAALRWATQAWGDGRVTRPYLRATLDEARRSLSQQAAAIRGKPSPPGIDLSRASAILDAEASLAAALAADVEGADRTAAQRHAGALEAVERDLRALTASLGS